MLSVKSDRIITSRYYTIMDNQLPYPSKETYYGCNVEINDKSIMAKKSSTKSFILRVDSDTMEALEKWADDEFRSINGQLQWIIADALKRSGRLKKGNHAGSDNRSEFGVDAQEE